MNDEYIAFHSDLALAVESTGNIRHITKCVQMLLATNAFDIDRLLATVCDRDLCHELTVTCTLILLTSYLNLGLWQKLDADTHYFLHKTASSTNANGLIRDEFPLEQQLQIMRNRQVLWSNIAALYQ